MEKSLQLVVWRLYRVIAHIARVLRQGATLLWATFCSRRAAALVTLVAVCFLFVGVLKVGPLVYGRYALMYEASHLARTASIRSPEEIRRTLIATAFRQGYTDVLEQPEAFVIENTYDEDGIPLCRISIDLHQQVHVSDGFTFPLFLRTAVVRFVEEGRDKPKSLEDKILDRI